MKTKELMKAIENAGPTFFEGLQHLDVIEPVATELGKGIYVINKNDKLAPRQYSKPPDWVWIKQDLKPERKCHIWMDVYFTYYRIIPKGCRHCWKVVVTMDHLSKLFKMVEIQEGMGLHSKCGMERRTYAATRNSYLAFWYAPLGGGLRGGRQLYKTVKEHLEKEWPDGGWTIMLKRGCTEMQQGLRSDEWDRHAAHFDTVEQLLDASWEFPEVPYHLADIRRLHTLNLWITWSSERNMDYLEYTGGKPFSVPQLPYHDSIHSEKDFPGLERDVDLRIVT